MKRFILAALILLFAVAAIKILSFKEAGNQPEQRLMKPERLMLALACVGMICLFIHVADLGKKTENKFSPSEEYEDIFYTENSKEKQSGIQEGQKDYDRWETEHMMAVRRTCLL